MVIVMTGTASELTDYNGIDTSGLIDFEYFSAWLFGNINADCLLSDISYCGCSILLPKDKLPPSNIFKLLIMSPDDDKKLHSVISARQCWIEKNATSSHNKVGMQFLSDTPDIHDEISVLIPHVSSEGGEIRCGLLQQ